MSESEALHEPDTANAEASVEAPEEKGPTGAERRQAFIAKLRHFDVPERGHPKRRSALWKLMHMCRAEIRDLKDAGYSINYVKTMLTDYRNAIRDRLDPEEQKWALKYLTLKKEEWWALRREYEKKVTAENQNLRELASRPLIEKAKEMLHSDSFARQAASLMLLTGRRSAEILKTAKFTEVPGRDDVVMFEGQAKTKTVEAPPYEIPILGRVSAKEVIKALSELREKRDFSQLDTTELNAKTAKTMNEVVERMYGNDVAGEKLKPKDLRAVYAAIAVYELKPDNEGPSAYLASILGHRVYETTPVAGDMSTAKGTLNRTIADSYVDFHINDLDSQQVPEELMGQGEEPEVSEEPDETQRRGMRV